MNKGTLAVMLQLVGVGWFLATCIVGGLLGGLWLDRRLDVLPTFTLIGMVLGTIVAFYGTYRMVLPLLNKDEERKDGGQKPS